MGAFITAWARDKTIRSCQLDYDRFIYADTDSKHLLGEELPKDVDIDDAALGKWSCEGVFERGRFLRAKTYIEQFNGKLHVTCAGMPDNVKKLVTWENFRVVNNDMLLPARDGHYPGKLMPNHIPGGIVLRPTVFEIRGEKKNKQEDLEKLFKKWEQQYEVDEIKEAIKIHGYIKTCVPGDRYYGDYKVLSRSIKSKYFRKNGLPIDVFATAAGYDINDLLERLWD